MCYSGVILSLPSTIAFVYKWLVTSLLPQNCKTQCTHSASVIVARRFCSSCIFVDGGVKIRTDRQTQFRNFSGSRGITGRRTKEKMALEDLQYFSKQGRKPNLARYEIDEGAYCSDVKICSYIIIFICNIE